MGQGMKNEKGFTFVEAIVVGVIIAVLAIVAIPSYTAYVKNAQISTAQSMCQLIGAAIIQTHNRGISFTANDWTDIGITNPSDNNWTYTFPALTGSAQLTATFAITATGQSGSLNGQTGTFLPLQTGTARWTGIL
jgi:type IV pilus assembly protein PilE